MSESLIRFDDGAGYEVMMGVWSRLVGLVFLDWIGPGRQLGWVDVGCGNGAFTELVIEEVDPRSIDGIDPSEAQLAFARQRPGAVRAHFHLGDAMALPFTDAGFDVAASALVIFFMPDPAKGVAEMARVVRPGGIVASYAWDLLGGGFPYAAVEEELRAFGIETVMPPHPEAAELGTLKRLWTEAGLTRIETRDIIVERVFSDFGTYWDAARLSGGLRRSLADLSADAAANLRQHLLERTPTLPDGRIARRARAHAIKGYVPG